MAFAFNNKKSIGLGAGLLASTIFLPFAPLIAPFAGFAGKSKQRLINERAVALLANTRGQGLFTADRPTSLFAGLTIAKHPELFRLFKARLEAKRIKNIQQTQTKQREQRILNARRSLATGETGRRSLLSTGGTTGLVA